MIEWQPILVSLKLAFITSIALLFISLPLAYFFSFSKMKWARYIQVLISLPLVLPPTVLGFYILILFSPQSLFGCFLREYLGFEVAFSFSGLVVGSIFYSLPFMVTPLINGFSSIPTSLIETSYLLGLNRIKTLQKVILPNIKPSLIAGLAFTFAHTMGEFGLVLMIGGNIPGKTRVGAIALFDMVEQLRYDEANYYAIILLLISLTLLLIIHGFRKR